MIALFRRMEINEIVESHKDSSKSLSAISPGIKDLKQWWTNRIGSMAVKICSSRSTIFLFHPY